MTYSDISKPTHLKRNWDMAISMFHTTFKQSHTLLTEIELQAVKCCFTTP